MAVGGLVRRGARQGVDGNRLDWLRRDAIAADHLDAQQGRQGRSVEPVRFFDRILTNWWSEWSSTGEAGRDRNTARILGRRWTQMGADDVGINDLSERVTGYSFLVLNGSSLTPGSAFARPVQPMFELPPALTQFGGGLDLPTQP